MKKYRIFVFLFNSEITLGDLIGRMIINFHQNSRRSPAFPGMVAKSFSHGVTTDAIFEVEHIGSVPDNTKCL